MALGQVEDGEEDTEAEIAKRTPTTLRALRDGVLNKLAGDENVSQMVNVTLKNSEAAERANELTAVALERHQEQTAVTNAQRERELAQSQARLDLDSQTARETIALRREELQAAGAREDKKDKTINELKSLMDSVQKNLADMGSVIKMIAERFPPGNGS
ncbi:uncharacterized protein MELLADRAFT_72294 [Melampsora larici-populina 98AG31]|uniref:Uncharacterized protein n=1 Tax=Melampsora larici-populina (strain 98AG31 / pathotype 3-4-7) TaxID=747676 RepID=F4RS31_MELLP|nr:uncharacterized protein MELLADRAFT_72294 [Melampsora larici-populina 98AG31]EGG04785.1 hypothetical protein MELLADRAFT_72294 [Melampsora larici-populina 98AG31]